MVLNFSLNGLVDEIKEASFAKALGSFMAMTFALFILFFNTLYPEVGRSFAVLISWSALTYMSAIAIRKWLIENQEWSEVREIGVFAYAFAGLFFTFILSY